MFKFPDSDMDNASDVPPMLDSRRDLREDEHGLLWRRYKGVGYPRRGIRLAGRNWNAIRFTPDLASHAISREGRLRALYISWILNHKNDSEY